MMNDEFVNLNHMHQYMTCGSITTHDDNLETHDDHLITHYFGDYSDW